MRSYREQLVEYEYTAHSSLVHSIDLPVAKFHFELSSMQVRDNLFHVHVLRKDQNDVSLF